MDSTKPLTAISIARNGKYHDAAYSVDGDVVSVIYWGRDGVTRRAVHTDNESPELAACQLLSQMVETQPLQMS